MDIDKSKCGPEYSLCPRCKYEDVTVYYADKCSSCTMVVCLGYDFLIAGIPVGSGYTHLHKNFEPKEIDNGI